MCEIRNVLLAAASLGDVVENRQQVLRFSAIIPDRDLAGLDEPEPVVRSVDVVLRSGDDLVSLQSVVVRAHYHVGALRRKQLMCRLVDQARS